MELNRKQLLDVLKNAKTFGANAIEINKNSIKAITAQSGFISTIESITANEMLHVAFDAYTMNDMMKAIATKKTPFVSIVDNGDNTATIDGIVKVKIFVKDYVLEFPKNENPICTIRANVKTFQTAIDAVIPFACDNKYSPNPILSGVHIRTAHNRMYFESTNRYYAARYIIDDVSYPNEFAHTFDANMLQAIADIKTNESELRIYCAEKHTTFTFGNHIFHLQHMDATYPDLSKIYDNTISACISNVRVNRKAFIDTLTTFVKTTNDKKAYRVDFRYDDEIIGITCEDRVFAALLDAGSNGIDSAYETAFNGKYMLKIVKSLEYDDVIVHVDEKNALNPLRISDVRTHGESFDILLLPFRKNA